MKKGDGVKSMPSDCGSCGNCEECSYTASEYLNTDGYPAVKCPVCDTEIITPPGTQQKKVSCRECGTLIEIVPVMLN